MIETVTAAPQVMDTFQIPNQAPVLRQSGMPATLDVGALIVVAVQRGDSIEVLNRLFDLQQRMQVESARQQFNRAFARFKGEAVAVIRNKLIGDGPLKGKKHAELIDVLEQATPALSKWGLSLAFRIASDERDWIKVACVVRHEAGHSEETEFGGPIDTGPGRNAIQARKSSVTYLERITALLALGLAEQDADDDGAGSGGATGGNATDSGLLRRLTGAVIACTTDAEALKYWKDNNASIAHWAYGHDELKKAVAAHRMTLKQAVAA